MLRPRTPEELAEALGSAAARGQSIRLGGAFSKDAMAGPVVPTDIAISTSGLSRVLEYDPRDLTISVEAGMRWADLIRLLADNGQTIPLDPPFFGEATVGGVIAANCSGPRRRLYGTARDLVIGMTFATLEGKLVKSGGTVVKNVAGLNMGKLMIGSFGTLAGIVVVNFKLIPQPVATRTFVFRFATLDEAISRRDMIAGSFLQPVAIDLVNPAAAARVGLEGFCLIAEATGVPAVLDRFSAAFQDGSALDQGDADRLWTRIREFTPAWLQEHPKGSVLRISTTLTGIGRAFRDRNGPVIARAGNGVVYSYDERAHNVPADWQKAAIEFAPKAAKSSLNLWPHPGSDFEPMHRIKNLFDPNRLLNPGRLYGRI